MLLPSSGHVVLSATHPFITVYTCVDTCTNTSQTIKVYSIGQCLCLQSFSPSSPPSNVAARSPWSNLPAACKAASLCLGVFAAPPAWSPLCASTAPAAQGQYRAERNHSCPTPVEGSPTRGDRAPRVTLQPPSTSTSCSEAPSSSRHAPLCPPWKDDKVQQIVSKSFTVCSI